MKVVCAWCKKQLGSKPPYEDTSVTHSICPECKAKYFPEPTSTSPLILKQYPLGQVPEKMPINLEVPIPPVRGAPMPPKEVRAEEKEWVYAKVGTTEVRGRRDPSGNIEIEQVSPSFNRDDFDRAVKIIEGKLRGVETPHTITEKDYETLWKPKGWELLPIGPTSTWRPDWGEWEAIRDIIQNALDETEAYQWGYDEQGLWIADTGRGVAVADFLLGPPKLKPDYARGRYGEGMKIAALALLRNGYSVHVFTVGRELWMVFVERILDTTPTYQLAALYRADGSRQGTKFHIIGYTGLAYEDRFTVNLPKSSILWEGPGIITQPKQRFNQLIDHAFPEGSRIFARDIYMRDINSPYSYNLWGFAMAPDRHAPAKEDEVWADVGRLWATVSKVELLETFFKMVKDPPIIACDESKKIDMSHWNMGVEPTSRKDYSDLVFQNITAWQKAWANVMGEDAVIRTDERWDNVVKHLGYRSVSINWLVRATLSKIIKTDTILKLEQQERLQETEVISDEKLDFRQMAHLKLARAIAAELFKANPVAGVYAAIIPPASDRTRTAGMYGTTTQLIYINLEQLFRGKDTIDALVHELAHHQQWLASGKAEDLVKSHAEAMTHIAARLVEQVARGAFIELLKEVSW